MSGTANILLLPGLGGSGPSHWQAIWAMRYPTARIVEQSDWDRPNRATWLARLTAALGEDAADRTILVAHSLGCALAVHWALCTDMPPRAMLLVAPADVDNPERTPDAVRDFAPMPMKKLPCPTAVVASADDPFVDPDRAAAFAWAWGAVFHPVGAHGHLNAASGIGAWAEGKAILDGLAAAAG